MIDNEEIVKMQKKRSQYIDIYTPLFVNARTEKLADFENQRIEYEKLHLGNNKDEIESIFKNLGYKKKTNSLHNYDDAWEKVK
jgi:hypothetical protein